MLLIVHDNCHLRSQLLRIESLSYELTVSTRD
jgi:hypothetical protein